MRLPHIQACGMWPQFEGAAMSEEPQDWDQNDIEPGSGGPAWTNYVRNIREHLGLTQKAMAQHLGMSLRAYSDVENGVSECRMIHMLAAERIALRIAKQRERPFLAPPSVRGDAMIFRRASRPA
jgi:DNA-binding XRE family transcriptional regulator